MMPKYVNISDVHIPKGFFEGLNVPKFLSWLESLSTANVEEVKHGHWIITEYDYYDCSVCWESYFNGCESMAEAKRRLEIHQDVYDYCPYCGAKMDGKEK